jgi:uncharacterized protein YndB with AHSA1/START domain
MSQQSIAHGSFVIERHYPVAVEHAYAAWTDPRLKEKWFIGPDGWNAIERTLDVRAGGEERLHGRFGGPSGIETLFVARYHQVLPAQRLVYVYDMYLNRLHHSLSLATVEFRAQGKTTLLCFTEQVAFLDGTPAEKGVSSRNNGTAAHLDRITQLFA